MNLAEFFLWLQVHSAAFSLLFSLVVTCATVAYVVFTKRLVDETQQLRQMETEPHLNVYFTPNAVSQVILDLVIQNSGRIEARNISWLFPGGKEKVCDELRKRVEVTILPELAAFQQGIRSLAPSQQIRLAFGPSFAVLSDPILQPIELVASYEYGHNKRGATTFVLSVSELLGMSWINQTSSATSLEEIAKTLKEITSARGSSSWSLLHVSNTSPEQIRREMEERYKLRRQPSTVRYRKWLQRAHGRWPRSP